MNALPYSYLRERPRRFLSFIIIVLCAAIGLMIGHIYQLHTQAKKVGVYYWTDQLTGCEYLIYGSSILPRRHSDGEIICVPKE